MQSKPSFMRSIQQLAVISFVFLAAFLLIINTVKTQRETTLRIEKARDSFVQSQRQLIKSEVEKVVRVINFEMSHRLDEAQSKAKARVFEASAIAENIYNENKAAKSDDDIKKLIIDALRPIRYDDSSGYYFINDFDGIVHLMADRPEKEGKNLFISQVESEREAIRDIIDIARSQGEGFHRYIWTKPLSADRKFQKVSYVKLFGPFDWVIGTGVYLDSFETGMHRLIYQYVDANRFGPNNRGYVFINELLDMSGGKEFASVYANPNRPHDKGKTISDEYKDAKGKMFRKEFLRGLREHGECFVDYWYRKINNPEPSPKISFFKLAGNGRFIVAAGVYTDDVEEKIVEIQSDLKHQLWHSYLYIISIIIIVICLLLLFIHLLSKKLTTDYQLFVDFFKQAANSSKIIEKKNIKFSELDQLAEYANQMLISKSKTEEDLNNERERLLLTLHSIVNGVVATDKNNRILIFNRVAEELTGWPQNEAVGKKLVDVFQLKEPLSLGGHYQQSGCSLEHDLNDFHATLTDRYGIEYQIVISKVPILGNDEGVLGNLIVFRDETEKLKTEAELLNVRKLESVGILAGGIAHDFNNILAGLFGNIELAKLSLDANHKAYKFIKTAHDSLERATHLTSQLLTFAKGGDPILGVVNLKQLIHDVVSFNLSGSEIKAVYDIPENLWGITADQGQISQVVSNLVINAQHAMPNGGHVYAHALNIPPQFSKLKVDTVMLQIRDEGVGVSKEIIDRIFDPYFSTKQTGSGLGLAMVRGIIEKHNGRISVESDMGQGTTFTVFLPADKCGVREEKCEPESSLEQPSAKTMKILVIDDDATVANVLTDMLGLQGYGVDVAQEGDTGIKKYRAAFEGNNPYGITFLDLTIPGGTGGKEAIKTILDIDPTAKIIAISGYSTDPIMANHVKYGFCGRLIKPFQLSELRTELSRVLSN
ncbi:MAG: two-component system cell cycle sensor histidine kinase/response regulator CckA [Desulforhopalus sp.]|jgi:two-component system cell cycle sensor histidine kinase/response regulator CckA